MLDQIGQMYQAYCTQADAREMQTDCVPKDAFEHSPPFLVKGMCVLLRSFFLLRERHHTSVQIDHFPRFHRKAKVLAKSWPGPFPQWTQVPRIPKTQTHAFIS